MNKMKCGRCGAENPAQNTQCWHCGLPFYTENPNDNSVQNMPPWQPPMPPYPKKRISTGWLIFYIASAVVALVLFIAIIVVAITPATPPAVPDNRFFNEAETVAPNLSPAEDAALTENADIPNDALPSLNGKEQQEPSAVKDTASNDAKGKIAAEDKAVAESKAKAKEAKKESKQQSKKSAPAPQDAPKSEEAKKDSGSNNTTVGGSTVGGSTGGGSIVGGSTVGGSTGGGSTGGGNSSVSSPTTEAAKVDTSVWE